MASAFVATNGCIEASLSTKQMMDFLKENDHSITKDVKEADLVVFWACGLREFKRRDSVETVRRLRSEMKSGARLTVWGCLTKVEPSMLDEVYDGNLIGPNDLKEINDLVDRVRCPINAIGCSGSDLDFDFREDSGTPQYKKDTSTYLMERILFGAAKRFVIKKRNTGPHYYVRVATGCTGACSYCTEKLTWGYVRSRNAQDIIREVGAGLDRGYSSIVLQAGDLGSYGVDTGTSLPTLLDSVIDAYKDRKFSLILSQVEPGQLMQHQEALKSAFSSGRIASIGIPVQSGSDSILKAMNRGYSSAQWREAIIGINRQYPEIDVTTHIMVGFPGETMEDLEATISLLDPPVRLRDCGLFIYSSSTRVRSSRMDGQVSEEEKLRRYNILRRRCVMHYLRNAG